MDSPLNCYFKAENVVILVDTLELPLDDNVSTAVCAQ